MESLEGRQMFSLLGVLPGQPTTSVIGAPGSLTYSATTHAFDATGVEIGESEVPLFEFAKNDAGYEKPGDHEKDVDANEPAGYFAKAAMEEDDEQNGNSPQSVDVAPILQPCPQLAQSRRKQA